MFYKYLVVNNFLKICFFSYFFSFFKNQILDIFNNFL